MAEKATEQTKESTQKDKNKQIIGMILIAAVIVLTVVIVFHFFGSQFVTLFEMLERGDQEEISAYLNQQGQWQGMLTVYLISILQVVSIFIPGMAIQVAAGLIFGWWKAFLTTYLGFVSGNVLVFIVARHLGDRIQDLIPQAGKSNWLTDKINGANAGFVIGLACLIPGVPNGIIPYVAASTNLSKKKFAFAIASSCWIQILCNCIAGHFLIRGQYLFMVLSIAVQIAIIAFVATHRDLALRIVNGLKNKLRSK